jgi:hypothetical protein
MGSEKRERLIDDLLDNALRQYGAAEPRAGLEDRVLARIQTEVRIEGRRVTPQNWSWWPVAIACAVLLLSVAGAFLARNHHTDAPAAKSHAPAAPRQIPEKAPEKIPEQVMAKASPRERRDGRPFGKLRAGSRPSGGRGPAQPPHLDQFPSPQPLSEQEILLARFVERFPREAAMIATAQTQLLAQEENEIERETPLEREEAPQNLQEQNP